MTRISDEDRLALQDRLNLLHSIRAEERDLRDEDCDATVQIVRLAKIDAIEKANEILKRYASEAPPAEKP